MAGVGSSITRHSEAATAERSHWSAPPSIRSHHAASVPSTPCFGVARMWRGKRRVHQKKSAGGAGGVFGWAGGQKRAWEWSKLTQSPPMFVSSLREQTRPDKYRTALDGFRGADNAAWTEAGGLQVGAGDALGRRNRFAKDGNISMDKNIN